MKKTLTLVGLGACVLLTFPSCKSTDDDGFFDDAEEALPMSFVGDDEAPPWESEMPDWLTEDTSNGPQIAAGDMTPLIPAPDEPVATTGGSVSSSQNRPDIAAGGVNVEDSPFTDTGVDPLSGQPIASTPATPPKSTASTGGSKTGTGKSTSGKSGKSAKGSKGGKKPKKVNEPTLIGYKVKKGDNLSSIAARSNTTVAQIRKDSGLKSDTIYPGQTIWVRYTPKGYTPPKNSGKGAKGSKGGKKGSSTSTPKGAKTHVVRSGETVSGIAKKHGVSTAAILKANGMTNADAAKMRPGKKLVIPKG